MNAVSGAENQNYKAISPEERARLLAKSPRAVEVPGAEIQADAEQVGIVPSSDQEVNAPQDAKFSSPIDGVSSETAQAPLQPTRVASVRNRKLSSFLRMIQSNDPLIEKKTGVQIVDVQSLVDRVNNPKEDDLDLENRKS